MIFLWILLGIVALIVLILLLSVHVDLTYDARGFSGYVSVLLFRYRFPARKRAAKKPAKPAPEEKPEKKEKQFPGGDLKTLLAMIRLALSCCGKLLRAVRVRDLKAVIVIASDDAFTTAMSFGGASAGVGVLFPLLEQNFRIKRKEFSILADFESTVPTVNLNAHASLRIGRLLAIALSFAYHFSKLKKEQEAKGKGEAHVRSKVK